LFKVVDLFYTVPVLSDAGLVGRTGDSLHTKNINILCLVCGLVLFYKQDYAEFIALFPVY